MPQMGPMMWLIFLFFMLVLVVMIVVLVHDSKLEEIKLESEVEVNWKLKEW